MGGILRAARDPDPGPDDRVRLQIRPPPSPSRQIATKITMPLRIRPALARPRRALLVNSRPTAAMIAPTAANGISSQLVIPTIGSSARTIPIMARMPQTRLIIPMVVSVVAGVMPVDGTAGVGRL